MFQQMLEALSDTIAGGGRQPLSGPSAEGLMQESANRFTAPTGDERGTSQDPEEFDPEAAIEEEAAEHAETDQVTDPDGHTHSSGGSLAWGGHKNGRIPASEMTDIGGGHRLEDSAASAWQRMVEDAKEDGVNLKLTDSYRSYDAQVSVRKRKGHKVATATPGTSIHGWGKAIDVAGDAARKWIQQNGSKYGWVWPEWAQRKGTKSFEPWHFEYRPGGGSSSGSSSSSQGTTQAPAPAPAPTNSRAIPPNVR